LTAVALTEDRLKALMLAALDGDAAAYRLLLSALSSQLRAYFGRRLGGANAEAEDLVQETLMAIHTKRATYDRTKPFTPWLHAVARYKLIDHFRQRRIRPSVAIDDVDEPFAEDESEATAARIDVERLLNTVPASGTLVRQVKIEGRTVAEAAAAAGISETAAKLRIHRGLKALATKARGTQSDGDT
jgi:RNA polymerase sigma-70 factor (ECF subfamily)